MKVSKRFGVMLITTEFIFQNALPVTAEVYMVVATKNVEIPAAGIVMIEA